MKPTRETPVDNHQLAAALAAAPLKERAVSFAPMVGPILALPITTLVLLGLLLVADPAHSLRTSIFLFLQCLVAVSCGIKELSAKPWRVVAGPGGLSWNRGLKYYRAAWEDVNSYYHVPQSTDDPLTADVDPFPLQGAAIIETTRGQAPLPPRGLGQWRIQRLVERHASCAPERTWRAPILEIPATGRAFAYADLPPITYHWARMLAEFALVAIGLQILQAGFYIARATEITGPAYYALVWPGFSHFVSLFLARDMLRQVRKARRLQRVLNHEILTVTQTGLEWTDRQTHVAIPWAEITRCAPMNLAERPFLPYQWEVGSATQTISFVPAILPCGAALMALIYANAPQLEDEEDDPEDQEEYDMGSAKT